MPLLDVNVLPADREVHTPLLMLLQVHPSRLDTYNSTIQHPYEVTVPFMIVQPP